MRRRGGGGGGSGGGGGWGGEAPSLELGRVLWLLLVHSFFRAFVDVVFPRLKLLFSGKSRDGSMEEQQQEEEGSTMCVRIDRERKAARENNWPLNGRGGFRGLGANQQD